MRSFKVNKNEAGQRFDKLLMKELNKAPKSFIYKMLRKKNITLNNKKAKGSEIVELGDEIKMFLADETIAKFSEVIKLETAKEEFQVIFEDKNILVVNKPAGLLSQKAQPSDISLNEQIIYYLHKTRQISKEELQTFKPSICNRLDRNTSGLVIAGKTLVGLQTISELFHDQLIDKYYLCIVDGQVEVDRLMPLTKVDMPREEKVLGREDRWIKVSGYLTKDQTSNKVFVSPSKTKDSDRFVMEYQPLDSKNGYTLLKIKLITGKTHQIRAHLASIGYPIIGDYKYGDRKTNKLFKSKYKLNHQLLHAWQIALPQIGGDLQGVANKRFEASAPEQFTIIEKDLF